MSREQKTYGRGQILRIDLSSGKITKEPVAPQLAQKYLGGEGINSRLLWEHFLKVDPKIDPLSPDNVLIAGTGPLAGTGYGQGSKMKWTFKSPAYNMFGDSATGGGFVFNLRMAGYDHVVITGKASKPSYIFIDDDLVEIRDAAHLWGRDALEADALIKQELGDSDVETALIGIGAENGVLYSAIIVSRDRAAGRTGGGTVMASKNLKGMAVRGRRGIEICDPEAMFTATDELLAALNSSPRQIEGWRRFGTLLITGLYQRLGVNAYRNNQDCIIPDETYRKLDHRWYTQNYAVAPLSCVSCVSGCSSLWRIKGDESPLSKLWAGERGSKPEYLGVGFGFALDIDDWAAVCHFWQKSNRYGIDAMETLASLSFLMELWQRGLITEKDTAEWMGEPVRLEWGNYEAVDKVMDCIAYQSNQMGEILKGGVYRAAQMIEELRGVPVLQYALYGKGGAAFVEEVRHTASWATNFAVASRGCDHLKGIGTLDKVPRPDISEHYFGTPDAAEPLSVKLKGANSAVQENRNAIINSLGLCTFLLAADPLTFSADMFARAVRAATGWDASGSDLLLAGERTVNLEKAFNSRLGLRREDDRLCERWMKERVPRGPGKGWKAEDYLERTKDEYYQWHGWDKRTSLQTRNKLEELDMGDVAEVLAREGALV